jgi:alkanesulfonate monooxygenase SsuD/methylene tetrahydromethanopterin reductase-like flavin-dependent oxidoreductase (luciferase family)
MRLGALLGPIPDPSNTHSLAEQARTFAGEGYSSLWSAQALGRGFMMSDPLIALTVAASVTENVEVGTAVLQVPLYHPVDLAHRVLSLRQICGDRLILGVGAGSTADDFAAFGQDYEHRFSTFADAVEKLRGMFTDGGSLTPWPSTLGGPPLFLGSWGKGVVTAATEFDGWIASAHYRTVDEIEVAIRRYRAAGGRRAIVSTIQVSRQTDLGELRDKLVRFNEAGFDDAVVMILPGGPEPRMIFRLVN